MDEHKLTGPVRLNVHDTGFLGGGKRLHRTNKAV
jgi:hypothetical protein